MRDLHLPGRSVVHGVNGAAATSHPLSTLAAIDILRAGGTAVDAAVAAAAVQGVVEPMATGIGGDCFALVTTGDGSAVTALNASGRAPGGLSSAWLLDRGIRSLGETDVHAVTVPGAVDGWDRLVRAHGRLGLDRILQPAIAAAEDGFAVSPRVALEWGQAAAKLALHPGARALYLKDGQAAPAAGDRWRLPALGRTLRAVAAAGRDGFYAGPVAEAMVRTLRAAGGVHTLPDFAATAGDFVTPLRATYGGVEIAELPPNTQGVLALLILNILSGFDLGRLAPAGAQRIHLQAEATRLAVAACAEALYDPAFAEPPVARLLSPAFADTLRSRIDPDRAGPPTGARVPGNPDTVFVTVVDRDRTVCSFINSLYHNFGSGIACPETGVLFHCRGLGFRIDPDHPNGLAPGKRPRHTLIPGLAFRAGRPWLGFGVMGAAFQAIGHVHLLTNLIDFGLDLQEAIDCPRTFFTEGCLSCENGVPDGVLAALSAMGHRVERPDLPWGGGQAVAIDWDRGTVAAGSDPRKDGCALAY